MATQNKAWHYALHLLEKGFLVLSPDQTAMLVRAKEAMMRSEDFLKARFQEVMPDLKKARGNGLLVVTCPTCEKMAIILGDGWPDCRVCDRDDIAPEQVADDYAAMWDWSWKHPKHGPDDDVAWCEECGEQAVVPAGDDVKEELIGTFSIPAPQEPGGDIHLLYEPYLCFACGTAVPSRFVCGCGSCGAVYVDSGEEEESQRLCPLCGRF